MEYTNETLVNVVKNAISSDYLKDRNSTNVSFELCTSNLFQEGNEFDDDYFLNEMKSIGLIDCSLSKREEYFYRFSARITDQYKPFFISGNNGLYGKNQQWLMGIRILLDNRKEPITIYCSTDKNAYEVVKGLEKLTGRITPYEIKEGVLTLTNQVSVSYNT